MTKRIRFFAPILVAAFALSAAAPAGAVELGSSSDGRWSVKIVPENGRCRTRTVALHVDEGQIRFAGFGARAEGAVRPNGALAVSIVSLTNEVVNASGSVAGEAGRGSWKSPNCDGSWTALRS
jgi:hypothetical protein